MLNKLAKKIRDWRDKKGFVTDWSNTPEKLMLIVAELSKAMEAYRHVDVRVFLRSSDGSFINAKKREFKPSEKALKKFCEELADAIIRILDITGTMGIDIEAEIKKKMKFMRRDPKSNARCVD